VRFTDGAGALDFRDFSGSLGEKENRIGIARTLPPFIELFGSCIYSATPSTLIHFVHTIALRAAACPSDQECRILFVLHRMQIQDFETRPAARRLRRRPGASRVHDPCRNAMVQLN